MLFCLWASILLLWHVNVPLLLYVMLSQDGCFVVNYLDHFIGISSPDKAFRDYDTCGSLLRDLGLQESPSKACPPSPVLTCLGVEVNSLALTLSVTRERLQELETLLLQWTTR